MKSKTIQTVTAWRYPCEGEKMHWEEANVLYWYGVFKFKKLLRYYGATCPCGKNCKPQKIRIIVEEIK